MADNDPAANPHEINLDAVQSLEAFARACDQLRAGRSYADLRKAARPQSLPAATLSDLLNAKGTPNRDTVITFLIACGLDDTTAREPWLAVWERVATAHQPHPAGAVRVRQARPRLLGVHAAIQVAETTEELPPYVPRDLDADLRTTLTAAAAQGGFVLLVGGSSVGKTRALYEAVRATMPERWLLHPADAVAIADQAEAPTACTVVWLDELQRYLNQPTGLPAGTLRQLITAGTVVVATLWPDEYSIRTARPSAGQLDPYANDRDLLRLADNIRVPDTLSPAERRRGEALAPTDQRIRVALDAADAGFTQVLAAGPALIHYWEQAPDCYGKAVITAALDARRVGAQHPVTRDFLEVAAPAYLTPAQQATAPHDWFDHGLTYAAAEIRGAAACLIPVPASMGRIAGYTTADYLYQHAQHARRTTALPDSVWHALAIHHHPNDALSLAENAERRGQPVHATTLYVRAESGGRFVSGQLAELLAKQGHVEELRIRADAGDVYAASRLADMLAKHGSVEELRVRADAGDGYAAGRLVGMLTEQGHVDDALQLLRTHADGSAASRLAELLAEQGHVEELRIRADAGDGYAASQLAGMLTEQGHVDHALQLLRTHADADDGYAAFRLADMLAEQGHVDDALQLLRTRADADAHKDGFTLGGSYAANRLAGMLAEQGRVEELRVRADASNAYAANRLAELLAEQGHIEELHVRADAGDVYAANRLVDMLAEQGHVDDALQLLRTRAAAYDGSAAFRLADMLAEQGHVEELRVRADAGDVYAAFRLAGILAEQGRIDELRNEVAAGTSGAAEALSHLLCDQPQVASRVAPNY